MIVTIERLGHLGDGIAPGPVYVPRALPGEEVEGEVDGRTMSAPRILTPSTDRVRPPCPHYKGCGGCDLQHARDEFVAEWKTGVVTAALAAQGLAAPVTGIHTSPPASRRRATFAGRRVKSGALVGFHGRASSQIVAVPDCRVLHPGILAALPGLEAIATLGASRKSEVRLAVTLTETGIDLSAAESQPLDRAGFDRAVALAEAADLARLTWNGEVLVTRRPPVLNFGRAKVVPPPGAFLQATAEGEVALLAAVREAVGPARSVVDLFAGCGTFALPLAETAEIHGVEGDPAMLAALDHGWRHAQGLRRVTTETRDLFRRPLMPDELNRFDAVVIDPPRAGAEAQMREIAQSDVARVAAVSCNPVSFARDAKTLADAGFTLKWLRVVDQFRWSPHIELAALFVRGHIPGN